VDAGDAFASRILPGGPVSREAEAIENHHRRRSQITAEAYAEGVLSGDRALLGRAITLVESGAAAHQRLAEEVLERLLPHTGKAIRVGITGAPGVGKSTFIEALGGRLLGAGHRVAVLAVDPSSVLTGGSILGDKTRMEALGRDPRCFIRPSPSGGTLGGVARKTRETLLVCEAAGYDVVLVETVGVGQSEVAVRSMVDFFLLLLLPGAGDELQGIKKGIIEIADALVVNKADGENRARAEVARQEVARALHYLAPARPDWRPPVQTCSALTGEGVGEVWDVVKAFRLRAIASGVLEDERRRQSLGWLRRMVEDHLLARFHGHPAVQAILPVIEAEVARGAMAPTAALAALVRAFEGGDKEEAG
jgi:LAO/AO transport system kinase